MQTLGRTTPLQLQVQRTPKQTSRKQPSRRTNRRAAQRSCVAQQSPALQQTPGSRAARQRKTNQGGEGSQDVVAATRNKSMPSPQGGQQTEQPGQLTSFFGKCVVRNHLHLHHLHIHHSPTLLSVRLVCHHSLWFDAGRNAEYSSCHRCCHPALPSVRVYG